MTTELIQIAVTAVFSAGGAYMAIKTDLKYMRIDIDRLMERVQRLEERA